MKDVQAIGEAFSPRKRTFSTSKHEIFLISVGHFCPPGSGSASAFLNADSHLDPATQMNADPDRSGSRAETLKKHWI